MRPEIKLTYYDEAGRLHRVIIETNRFTIGRVPDNDLMIEHSSLSRRHALIESFDNTVQISDCGSINGTLLNGAPVTVPVALQDGDVITLADACDVTVEFGNEVTSSRANPSAAVVAQPPFNHADLLRQVEAGLAAQKISTLSARPTQRSEPQVPFASSTTPEGLNVYIIAPVMAVVILALVVIGAIALKGGGSKKAESDQQAKTNRERTDQRGSDESSDMAPIPSPEEGAADRPSDPRADELEVVEKNALAVLRSISKNDTSPVLTEQNLKEIDERIQTYKGSGSLRDNLRVMKQRGIPQLSGPAKSNDVKLAFVVFAGLARVDKDGQRGDPVAAAQSILPVLAKNSVIFSDELAHDNLINLVSTDPSTGSALGLRDSVSDLTKRRPDASPATIRNIWFLRENQKITPQAYDLVMRFLAIGAIAQDPRHYGIEAEPLTF